MPQRQLVGFDWAIKRLLRSKANFGILEGFLSELLHDDIRILEVLNNESYRDAWEGRFNCVEIKVRNRQDEIVIVELLLQVEVDYLQQILCATPEFIAEHPRDDIVYEQGSKFISVRILYFDLGRGEDYVYVGNACFTGMHTGDRLALDEKQLSPFSKANAEYYLVRVNQFDGVVKNALDEWIYFLKNETIEDNFQAKSLKQAKEQLDVLKLSYEARRDYDLYVEDRRYQGSMWLSSYGVGYMDGLEEGRRKAGQRELLIEVATTKYGALPPWAEDKLYSASTQDLQTWGKTIFAAESLEAWLT